MTLNPDVENEAEECIHCEKWFDVDYIEICGECDEYMCPPCGKTHVCEPEAKP